MRLVTFLIATLLATAAFANKERLPRTNGARAKFAMSGIPGATVTRVERAPQGSGFRFHFRRTSGAEGYRDGSLNNFGGRVSGALDMTMITRDASGKVQDPARPMRIGEK